MGERYHDTPANASLLAAGIIKTKHYEHVTQEQIEHKVFFRYGSHLNKYSAKDFVRTYVYLGWGVTDMTFFAPRNDDDHTFHVVFTTDWR